ncbi:floral homeotic protein PMADS 2 [Morus notabilis]|uniref:floral homeotic protein PMADS 2 n=1 Tax=Morus notabilis TaxID=981085 RepID=UPI000CED1504|nr:floral homeotic protein PMADS 2 [Morus notabilis]
MGRGKIEIKRIENSNNRSVTYSKRKKGIIKKAQEISILCDAKVSLIIYGPNGKIVDFCSPETTSLSFIAEEYQRLSGKRLWDLKHENLNTEIEMTKKENENMDIHLRHMKGQEIQSLNHRELMALEDTLYNGLQNVRAAQMECINQLRQKDEFLESENKRLTCELFQKMGMQDGVLRSDYNSHMSFAFRVQPMQPNLQERM